MARHREAYHEPLSPEQREGQASSPDADHRETQQGAPSIHDLESQLTEIPPIDTEPRGLFVDRVVAAATSRDDFVAGRVSTLRSWAGQAMTSQCETVDPTVTVRLHIDDLHKTLEIAPRSITCTWKWNSSDYPADAWFTTELSYSIHLDLDAPGAEGWNYPIETVAKSEKGFDRLVQGTAVVLRWRASAGKARVTVAIAAP